MTWALVGLLTAVLVEMFLRLPLVAAARAVALTGRRAARTLGTRGASDHWKEKASRAYAGLMLKGSLVLAGGLGLIAVAGTLLTLAAERLAPGTTAALLSWPGLLLSLVVATVYVMARQRLVRL
ncbi:MAG: hypothetical protein ACE5FS_03930 [Paracoccaceae bacterium]